MAPVVVLVVAVLAPVFSFPFSTPEYTPGTQIDQGTPLTSTLTQVQSGVQEKTGAPVPTGCATGYPVPANQYQQNVPQPLTRVQDAPVNVNHAPLTHTETPLFLSPQPVPVVPVGQAEQVIRPVVVPAEAIATGRVIIMAVEPIQQRAFPDVVLIPQQQQIVTETYPPIQAVEKLTTQENYSPVQTNFEQFAQQNQQQNYNEVPQKQAQVPNTQQQIYNQQVPIQGQSVQEQVQNIQKQAQTGVEYTPNTQTVETVQPAQRVQTVEQQLPENVQQQVYSAQQTPVQKQQTTPVIQTQQRVYVPEKTKPQQSEVQVQQQTYSAQPEQVVQSVEPQQEVQQQVSEYVPHPTTKTGNQQVHVPHQVETYTGGQTYNFGDRIPQQQQVQDAVSQQQQYLGQPVVVENQQ